MERYADARHLAFCALCGGATGTRDHVPSRVFLDEPYPEDLPTVPACEPCNLAVSADEQYLACLIECVRVGSTDPEVVTRPKVRATLERSPALASRIRGGMTVSDAGVTFAPEGGRVVAVLRKLGRGHALYNLNEPQDDDPEVWCAPLTVLSEDERVAFEHPSISSVWPEVGSRAMVALVGGAPYSAWRVIQPGRYRYAAFLPEGGSVEVRMVLSEYLAARVIWRDA